MAETCLSGDDCTEETVASSTFPDRKMFCHKHQKQLDFIREHIENKAWANNIRNKAEALEAFCETQGCDNRPLYGSDYCDECQGND